MVIVVIITNHD